MSTLLTVACSSSAHAQDAASLRAKHQALSPRLADTDFKRPIHLQSTEDDGALEGNIHARLDQAFGTLAPALRTPGAWCDILMLHLNVKACRSSASRGSDKLSVNIGRKFDQPLADTYRVDFQFKLITVTPDYLQVLMTADEGPLGTHGYRIQVELVALDTQQSFIHLSYAYAYGLSARAALKTYLSTLGRSKIGFSRVDPLNPKSAFIGGTRGMIERNTMRYYLAIDAYLGTLNRPAASQLEARLEAWHAGVERYPAQLHELSRHDYLAMKRREVQRQRPPLDRIQG